MSAFGKQQEVSESAVRKLFVGIENFKVIAVNPTKEELEKMYGREINFNPEYLGETEVEDGDAKRVANQIRLDFYLSNEDESIQGFMSIGFSAPSIIQIVSNMFGEEFNSMTDEVREAVGEIANMISGQARQGLSAIGVKLDGGLPTIITGKELDVNGTEDKPILMVKFEVEKGPFELGVCIEGMLG